MNFPTTKLNALFETSAPLEGIVSLWGDFGVGKTTFTLQTALNTAMRGNKVIYIYSKPNLPSEKIGRILQIGPSDDSSDILDNIIFIQTTGFDDLNTIVFNLEFLVLSNLKEKNSMLKLIIVDSLTDLYRLDLDREKKSKNISLNSQLNQIMANLFFINETYSIEVLIVNEISRKNQDGQTVEVQSGGKVMDYWVLYSIKLERSDKINERKIVLTKHPENLTLEFTADLAASGFSKERNKKFKNWR